MGLKQIDFSQLALVNGRTQKSAASIPPTLATLTLTSRRATTHYLRDGEVVLYRRPDSGVWQVRYKLLDRRWCCITTRQRQLEWARRAAGEIYDRARFRELEGLPQQTKRFDAIANLCIQALEREIEQGIRPQTNRDYIRAINSYLKPYFGKFMLLNITLDRVRHYEQWRNEKMGREPISST
jgi:hypothetical protein